MYEGSHSRFLEKSIPFAWNALPTSLSIMAASHHSGLCSCHLLREAFPKTLHPQSGEALPHHTPIHTYVWTWACIPAFTLPAAFHLFILMCFLQSIYHYWKFPLLSFPSFMPYFSVVFYLPHKWKLSFGSNLVSLCSQGALQHLDGMILHGAAVTPASGCRIPIVPSHE